MHSGIPLGLKRILLLCLFISVLSACGGGSSSGSGTTAPVTPAPTTPVTPTTPTTPVTPPPSPPPTTPPTTPVSGLDARPQNLSCLASDPPATPAAEIALDPVFPALSFSQPLGMFQAASDNSRWFVLEKTGRIRVFNNTPAVASFNTDFLNLTPGSFDLNSSGEGGLLGMAFDPEFATNGQVYVSWTRSNPMVSVISRFTSADGGQTLNTASRTDIISINQDFNNHNGGTIAFGSDSMLYIGLGDGGSANDPNSRAQDTTNMLGSFLRIDVNGAAPYTIPADNPFAGNAICPANHSSLQSCPEIYAWGVRNPWRWSFDSATGQLWAADVGQGAREEIDIIERNGNYGWDCHEGAISFSGGQAPSCASTVGFVEPVHDYPRSLGISVTGGYVYRGSAIPNLTGHYLFADYGSGRIWRLLPDGNGSWNNEELLDTTYSISSFGQGNDGELYVIDIAGGDLYRIEENSAPGAPSTPVPTQLSATGCVLPSDATQPASGLIPYEPIAAFWSDNAVKERWLALPDGGTITVNAEGDFEFPAGSVLMKHFRLGSTLVETRLLLHHNDDSWSGYSYEWNATGTDATLVTGGKVSSKNGQDWIYPGSNDCLRCHTAAAGVALGLETAQLNHDFLYTETGRMANQLFTLEAIAALGAPLPDVTTLPSMADPEDSTSNLNDRARAYLHTNCAQCHRPGGPTPSSMDLRFDTALNQTSSCDAPPQSGNVGLGTSARIIDPGNAANSVLLARLQTRDANGMPPLGSALVDTQAANLVRDWINNLGTCL